MGWGRIADLFIFHNRFTHIMIVNVKRKFNSIVEEFYVHVAETGFELRIPACLNSLFISWELGGLQA